jgi:hypothetical protein
MSDTIDAMRRKIGKLKSELEGMTRSRDKWQAKYESVTAAIRRAGGLPKKQGAAPEGK